MDRPPSAEAETAKTKYRPQQSCIKCRERKVKCDRALPCQACCARGLQAECEYVSNSEDRYQINQADVIDSLRKEVGRLKRRLIDVEPLSPSSANTEPDKSPPASQGPRKTQKRTSEISGGGDSDGHYHVGHASLPPPVHVPNQALDFPSHGHHHHTGNTYQSPGTRPAVPMQQPSDPSTAGPGYYGTTMSAATPVYNQGVKRSAPQLEAGNNFANPAFAESEIHHQLQHQQVDFWKGKQGLLQIIYKIIRDCDEARVPSVIDVVRNSTSPEEALASIRRLLNTSLSSTTSSSDGGLMDMTGGTFPGQLGSSMTPSSDSHSPEGEENGMGILV